VAAGILQSCASLRTELVSFDPELFSGADCVALVRELAVTEKALAAARALAASRAAGCAAYRASGEKDAANWLSGLTGQNPGQARKELETAKALENCPATAEAVRAGELSLEQAGEIARTEAECPGSEHALLGLAKRSGLSRLRDEGRRRRLGAADPEELYARQRAARSFRHWTNDMGMVAFSGALSPDVGIALMNRIDTETDRLRRAAKKAAGPGPVEAWEAHAADALVAMLEGKGTGKSKGADVVIVCDLFAYRRGHAHDGEACHIVGGGPIPVGVVRDGRAEADAGSAPERWPARAGADARRRRADGPHGA